MTSERQRPEDRLEASLSAHFAGDAGAMREASARLDETGELQALQALAGELRVLRARIPASSGDAALAAMMGGLENARMNQQSGGIWAALAGWWKRPALRTGAAVSAVVLVLGGASLGAAAATGNEPARNLLGISTNSAIKVEFTGTVVTVNGPVVEVSANGDVRIVIIDENTDMEGDNDEPLPLDAILAGQIVEVHGRLQPDNSILATRFHLEDGSNTIGGTPTAGAPTAAVPTTDATATVPTAQATVLVPTAPAAQPTFDDDDDDGDGDDNRGHGNDDDGDDDDNPGQGNGNGPDGDRDDNDDNSGPGNGDDNDDNSGPGNGDDDDDGNSGSGDDDDDDDDDNSSSGSGSGGDGDDNSGSGSAGDD